MAAVPTPLDWMDLADWDRYWSEVLASPFWKKATSTERGFARTSLQYLLDVEQRREHRVLLSGNGISHEPFGFRHAGCDVTVVDVSTVACQHLASIERQTDALAEMFAVFDKTVTSKGATFLTPNKEKSQQNVATEWRPGGSISIVAADLFAYEPKQPFNAIISRKAYQALPMDRREELARRFYRWLQPGGTAFVEMLNIRGERELFEEPFIAAGFQVVKRWTPSHDSERHVLFWHGSG